MKEQVAKMHFFRGVLFALREHLEEFNTHPIHVFHGAFGGMLTLAKKTIPSQEFEFLLGIRCDPIFGTYDFASEMILEGQQDLILVRFGSRIRFEISANESRTLAREHTSHSEWFRSLAQRFTEELASRKSEVIV